MSNDFYIANGIFELNSTQLYRINGIPNNAVITRLPIKLLLKDHQLYNDANWYTDVFTGERVYANHTIYHSDGLCADSDHGYSSIKQGTATYINCAKLYSPISISQEWIIGYDDRDIKSLPYASDIDLAKFESEMRDKATYISYLRTYYARSKVLFEQLRMQVQLSDPYQKMLIAQEQERQRKAEEQRLREQGATFRARILDNSEKK